MGEAHLLLNLEVSNPNVALHIRQDFYDYSNENSKLDFVAYVEDMGRIYDSWQMTSKHVPPKVRTAMDLN